MIPQVHHFWAFQRLHIISKKTFVEIDAEEANITVAVNRALNFYNGPLKMFFLLLLSLCRYRLYEEQNNQKTYQ